MIQSTSHHAAPAVHPDAYPIIRTSTEFFLRSFDLMREVHEDTLSALIVLTLWHAGLVSPGRKPMGIRELARKLDLPYETVRRHVRGLVQGGDCLAEGRGLVLPPAMPRGATAAGLLRKMYLNAVRMLTDLTRIGIVDFKARSSLAPGSKRLGKEPMAIAVAAIGLLLAAMRVLRGFFGGDLVKGLVFTGIRAANVKHVVNGTPAGYRSILPDVHRLPVSVLAISDSMRLPYETVRRHADALVKEGNCIRIERRGLMVPESAFRHMSVQSVTAHQLVLSFVDELRAAGVKV